MSTSDYWTEGEGPCPCGRGKIIVTGSMPDHPWARDSQKSYSGSLQCDLCRETYAIVDGPKLVLRSDAVAAKRAGVSWHQTLREIEALPAFKELQKALAQRLASERSKAAEHRVLVGAGFWTGSVGKYRRGEFTLRPSDADKAVALVGTDSAELKAKIREAHVHWEARRTPAGIETGIRGMTM